MKFWQILVLVILVFGVGSAVEAQICGPSKTKIYVRDTSGNIVKDAKFEFPELEKDSNYFKREWLKFEADAYIIYFFSGKPYGNNLLKISAPGFVSSRQSIRITEAQYQVFNLVLGRVGTSETESFEELVSFWGEVKDTNKVGIPNARVILTGEKGEKIEVLTEKNGGYSVEALPGKYDFEFVGTKDFVSAKYQNYEVSKNQNNLSAVLEVGLNDNFLAAELVCTPHQFLANRFNCALVTKNPVVENQK
jgi:hypothetical protein